MPRRWPVLTTAVVAAALAIALVPVVASLAVMVRGWWWLGEAWWSAPAPFLGPHEPLAWSMGGLVPAAALAGAIARWAERRVLRLLVGLWGLVQIAFGGLAVVDWASVRDWDPQASFPTEDLVGFALAGLAAIVVAAGFVVCARTRRESVVGAVIAVVLTAIAAGPSIVRAIEDACAQPLPSVRVELVAARFVADDMPLRPHATLVEHAGERYDLDEADTLVLTDADLQRVRWEPLADGSPAFTVVLRGDARARLRKRSHARLDMQDALRIDGRVLGVALYRNVLLDGALQYTGGDRPDEVRAIYRALTGLEPG